jgi:hypothetical protein
MQAPERAALMPPDAMPYNTVLQAMIEAELHQRHQSEASGVGTSTLEHDPLPRSRVFFDDMPVKNAASSSIFAAGCLRARNQQALATQPSNAALNSVSTRATELAKQQEMLEQILLQLQQAHSALPLHLSSPMSRTCSSA